MALTLKTLRTSQGMTLETLAAKSGVSKGFLSQIENGKRGITMNTMRLISAALGVGVADLFDDAQEQENAIRDDLEDTLENLDEARRLQVLEYAKLLLLQKETQRSAELQAAGHETTGQELPDHQNS